MQKSIKFFSVLSICLSIIFFLYGSIKVARLEKEIPSQTIKTDIAKIQIVQPDEKVSTKIFEFSGLMFLLGILGIIFPFRFPKNLETAEDSITPNQVNTSKTAEDSITPSQVNTSKTTEDNITPSQVNTSKTTEDNITPTDSTQS